MLLQELNPEAPCLPEHTAKRIVEYGEIRLQKSGVDALVATSSSSSATTMSILTNIDEIPVTDLLGQGSFSTVYQLANHKDRVVKVLKPKLLKKPALFAGCAADLVREGILLSHLSHPNLLKCYAMGTLAEFSNGRHDSCALLLERLDITLKDQLTEWRNKARVVLPSPTMTAPSVQEVLFVLSGTRHRRLRQTLLQRTDVLCQLADAIHFLHANGIMHRDLKPDNIGLVGTTLKVFDLDVCRILPREANHCEDLFQFTKHVGSPRYMAPEVARGERYNVKADVYAFGLLAYELLSLQKAYHDIPSDKMDARVFYQGARPHCPSHWPKAVTLFLSNCWADTVGQRPTMAQVLEELRETLDQMCPGAVKKRRNEQLRKQHQQETSRKRLASEESGRTFRSDTTLEGGPSQ